MTQEDHRKYIVTKTQWTCSICLGKFNPRMFEIPEFLITHQDGKVGAACRVCMNQLPTYAKDVDVGLLKEHCKVRRAIDALEGKAK